VDAALGGVDGQKLSDSPADLSVGCSAPDLQENLVAEILEKAVKARIQSVPECGARDTQRLFQLTKRADPECHRSHQSEGQLPSA
jgi:hypothetical protein